MLRAAFEALLPIGLLFLVGIYAWSLGRSRKEDPRLMFLAALLRRGERRTAPERHSRAA